MITPFSSEFKLFTVSTSEKFSTQENVRAPFHASKDSHSGKVVAVNTARNSNGFLVYSYDVRFDNGGFEEGIPEEVITACSPHESTNHSGLSYNPPRSESYEDFHLKHRAARGFSENVAATSQAGFGVSGVEFGGLCDPNALLPKEICAQVEGDVSTHQSNEEVDVAYGGQICSVCVSPDQRFLATAGTDREIRLWSVKTHVMVTSFKVHSDIVRSVQFSSDSKLIASAGDDRTICVCDVDGSNAIKTRARLEIRRAHSGSIRSIAFLSDGGRRLVSGGDDRFVRVWDVSGHGTLDSLVAQIANMRGHSGPIYSISVSPDSRLLATASFDQTLKVWDISKLQCLHTLEKSEGGLNACAFSPDGNLIAYGGDECYVCIWNVGDRKQIARIQHSSPVTSCAWSSDGSLLASADWGNSVVIWNTTTFLKTHELVGHTFAVNSVLFYRGQPRLVSGSSDRSFRVWDTISGSLLKDVANRTEPFEIVEYSTWGCATCTYVNDEKAQRCDMCSALRFESQKIFDSNPFIREGFGSSPSSFGFGGFPRDGGASEAHVFTHTPFPSTTFDPGPAVGFVRPYEFSPTSIDDKGTSLLMHHMAATTNAFPEQLRRTNWTTSQRTVAGACGRRTLDDFYSSVAKGDYRLKKSLPSHHPDEFSNFLSGSRFSKTLIEMHLNLNPSAATTFPLDWSVHLIPVNRPVSIELLLSSMLHPRCEVRLSSSLIEPFLSGCSSAEPMCNMLREIELKVTNEICVRVHDAAKSALSISTSLFDFAESIVESFPENLRNCVQFDVFGRELGLKGNDERLMASFNSSTFDQFLGEGAQKSTRNWSQARDSEPCLSSKTNEPKSATTKNSKQAQKSAHIELKFKMNSDMFENPLPSVVINIVRLYHGGNLPEVLPMFARPSSTGLLVTDALPCLQLCVPFLPGVLYRTVSGNSVWHDEINVYMVYCDEKIGEPSFRAQRLENLLSGVDAASVLSDSGFHVGRKGFWLWGRCFQTCFAPNVDNVQLVRNQ